MRITIVGTGYVGLVAGTCFAETGNEVLCLDIDSKKIERLSRGEMTLYEPGLQDLFQRNLREHRLTFSTSYEDATRHARIFFLCLPTPPAEDGSADVKYVLGAVRELSERLTAQAAARLGVPTYSPDRRAKNPGPRAPLFVLKSTVPVGTHVRVTEELRKLIRGPFVVASNPEFLKEGAAVEDFLKPDRVVLGVSDDHAFETLHALYEPFCRTGAPILRMNPASAELTKYAANGFLATKISFMNEIARLCEPTGADVEEVRKGISLDPRIGKTALFPGVGYGGSCFPKDTRALVATARSFGQEMAIVGAAERVNETQKTILFSGIEKHFGGELKGRTVGVWGLAFKPRTDDIREAPALALIERLLRAGARVQAFDPEAMDNVQKLFGDRIFYAKDPYGALEEAEALVLMTEWNEFRSPNWSRVKALLKTPAIFDGRNIYDPARLRELGFLYWGIGRK